MALNYYAINKIIGGKMVSRADSSFGHFRLLDSVGAVLGAAPREKKFVEFTYQDDAKVAQAFETMRDGAAPERILWDPVFAKQFHRTVRRLGIHAPAAQVSRRLLTIRKNPARYKAHGVELSKTTKIEAQASIVQDYAHVIEFALVKLRYQHDVTIDDILLDPELGQDYENIAMAVAPELSSSELRLGALYVRKTRHLAQDKLDLFSRLDTARMDEAIELIGNLNEVSPKKVPASEGLIELMENDSYLYVARSQNLKGVVQQLVAGNAINLLTNDFWKPTPAQLSIRLYRGDSFDQTPIRDWQLKLIHDKRPVFNWPIVDRAA